jgi:hypothetical protein
MRNSAVFYNALCCHLMKRRHTMMEQLSNPVQSLNSSDWGLYIVTNSNMVT